MKDYSGDITPADRFRLPSGEAFPRNPKQGELFWLTLDMPITNTVSTWHPAGVYYYNYGSWIRIDRDTRDSKAAIIDSRVIDVEEPEKLLTPPRKIYEIGSVAIHPSNIKAGIAGSAAIWVEARKDANVILSLWRDNEMISMAVENFSARKPKTMSLTFFDHPLLNFPSQVPHNHQVVYSLYINTDVECFLCVNRGNDQFVYDEVSAKTAIIAREVD